MDTLILQGVLLFLFVEHSNMTFQDDYYMVIVIFKTVLL